MSRTLLCVVLLATQAPGGSSGPPVPDAATEHFYREDHHTGAEYLRLGRAGHYETVGVEHMGRWRLDSGRWEVSDDRVVLHSDSRVRDVVTHEYRVFLSTADDVALLPALRSAAASFLTAHPAAPRFSPDEVRGIRTARPATRSGDLSVEVNAGAEFGPAPLTPATLRTLLDAIDSYLEEPDTRAFSYRLLHHRGFTVLYCLDRGGRAVFETPDSIRERIEKGPGQAPPYLFVEVSREVFSKGVGRNYPFKFFPEMNRAR